ncbi:AAA family ATPase [Candidatus Spongiihabitans sp.]|uniref:AAA family ATPase n=1 Tax=Candidatus Spongiihabitans sp. TaxID=3101308 RepID=UPI003C79AD07
MSNIDQWLSGLGLEQYTESFAAHDIDMDILGELSEPDLEALNVSLGHRKKILKAFRIAANNADRISDPLSTPSSAAPSPDPSPDPTPGNTDAERRYMTLMFCDLVDSTRIAAGFDIEDMRDLNRAYQTACAEAIKKFDGYVACYMGDGVLAYFGYPAAREDDAERAIWAGLELARRVNQLNQVFTLADGMTLSVRIGVATGRVVVETIGDDPTQENAVVGEAPNLATRLQGLAAPNAIVVGADTHRLIVNTFEFIDLGEQPIKGYAAPVQIWQVQPQRPIEQRFRRKRNNPLTPLIGREEELILLTSRWRRACENEGQVVLLSGEAGIGKTRLIDALLEQINEPHHLLRFYCSPYHSHSPLYPYLANLMRESMILPADDDQAQYLKLKQLVLGKYKFDENFLHTITALIALQVDDNAKFSDADPQCQLQLAQESLINYVIELSESEPVFFVVEDTHWIDPTTLKVLDLLVTRNHAHSIMLLLSHRPNKSCPDKIYMDKPLYYAQSHVTHLSLTKLTARQSQRLIGEISNNAGLEESIIQSISDKSAGIPLFIEEVTKVMLDTRNNPQNYPRNGQASNDQTGANAGPSIRVPDTLQASLLSMLDGLGAAKHLAQCASVIGNAFEKPLLRHICEQTDETVESGLENLVNQNIIYRQSGMLDSRFLFRHALLRDAAYESLLKKNRRKIHGMIAQYLSPPDLSPPKKSAAASDQQVTAYHYGQAGDDINAFNHWLNAGETAFNSGATIEAVELLDNAASHLPEIDPSRASLNQIYRLHMTRGRALNAALGAVSEEAHAAFRNAVSVARRMNNIEREIDALDWEFGITFNAGMIRQSLMPAQTILDIGINHDHLAAKVSGHQVLGMAHCALGEFVTAQQHLESALDTNGPAVTGYKVTGLNCYPSMTLDYLSYVKFFIGDKKSAQSLCRQAIESARQESDYATASALSNSCFTQMLLGDTAAVRAYSEEVIDLARDRGQHMFINRGLLFQNLAIASIDQDSLALQQVVQATNTLFESKEEIDLTYLLGMTAEIQISLGDYRAAHESLERALTLSHKNEELFYQAELYRLKAELAVANRSEASGVADGQNNYQKNHPNNHPGDPRSYLDKALEIANRQKASGWIDKINHTASKITPAFRVDHCR